MRFIHGHRNRPNPEITLDPLGEWEIQERLEREPEIKKKTICLPGKELVWGPQLEIGVTETLQIQNSDFLFTEAIWQIATPKVSTSYNSDKQRNSTNLFSLVEQI